MTNHTKPGRVPGIPKEINRAFRQDSQPRLKATPITNKLAERYEKVANNHPSKRIRERLRRNLDKAYEVIGNQFHLKKKLQAGIRSYWGCLVNIGQSIEGYIKGSFEEDGTWKHGVKMFVQHHLWQMINEAGKIKILVARIARELYPNSNKVAPHAGMLTWNGLRKRETKDGRSFPKYTQYVIDNLKIKNVWSLTQANAGINDPEDYCRHDENARREWHADMWAGFKKKEMFWDIRKYQTDDNDLTLSASLQSMIKRITKKQEALEKPKKIKHDDPEWYL